MKNVVNAGMSIAFVALLLCGVMAGACSTGLGEEVDLEAPIIAVTELASDGETITEFAGGVYCKKGVTFTGTATDNKAVTRVYSQIKWAGTDAEFTDFMTGTLSGTNWQMELPFEQEGVAVVRFVAEDASGNVSPKSSKTLILFVDNEAPVMSAWYIDRELNGIQYNLRDLDALQALNLDLTENKDAAQNVSFTINANATDTMGVDFVSIELHDEDGNLVCAVDNANTESEYAPYFKVTQADIVNGAKLHNLSTDYSTGKHYLQVWYNAGDVVTVPEANTTGNTPLEGGWLIWWPESDEPRLSQSVAVGSDGSVSVNIKDVLSLSVFDDDALEKTYCALLTKEEAAACITDDVWARIENDPGLLQDFVDVNDIDSRFASYSAKTGERDTTVLLRAAETPQTMHLLAIAWDATEQHNMAKKDLVVHVVDDSTPILLITSPKNNTVPATAMSDDNAHAVTTIEGQTLDSVGCSYLEFVWVSDALVPTGKTAKAKAWLNDLAHEQYAPTDDTARKTVGTGDWAGMTLWSVPLAEDGMNGQFIAQTFSFDVDMFGDFVYDGTDERASDKFFVAKLTRKDGNFVYAEYKLMADTLPPDINPIFPAGDMQIVATDDAITLEFSGIKASGLGMNIDGYDIKTMGNTTPLSYTPYYDTVSKTYKVVVSKDDLVVMKNEGIQPRYEFTAVDLFGNVGTGQYTLVLSNLPSLKSISSPSAPLCKMDDVVTITASFSNTIYVTSGNPYIKLKGITNDEAGITADTIVPAYYTSGSGSTTLVFSYTVQKGDVSDGLQVYNEADKGPIEQNGALSLASTSVHLTTLSDGNNLQDKKTIRLDGIPPEVTDMHITPAGNLVDGITYMNENKTLKVTITADDTISVQGTPSFVFAVGSATSARTIELPFTSATDKSITFSKQIEADDTNGALYYTPQTCINGSNVIVDVSGNGLVLLDETTAVDAHIVIDTRVPATPTITTASGDALTSGMYQGAVTFQVSTERNAITQYSTDGGSTWTTYEGAVTQRTSAQLTARATDLAGNVSDYPPPIDLDINGTFPEFSLECTKPNGNYKAGTSLTFRVSFGSKVNIAANAKASIKLSGQHAGETVGSATNPGYAYLSSTSAQTGVLYAEFVYEIQDPDEFTLKVAKDAVTLAGITDLYGNGQGTKTLSADYTRSIKCDGVAPKVKTMTPGGTKKAGEGGNVIYTEGNKITLVFSEEIQKSAGNLTLRQTYGWAIPPVLTATDFNIICNAISESDKEILSMQENGKDMEDSENLYEANVGTRNRYYHGKGQYVGPYKKSTQGLKLSDSSYVPDISTKYVLDFDIDIWETDTAHPIGKTFRTTGTTATLKTVGKNIYDRYTAGESAEPKTPSTTRTAGQIRSVLEKAHFHERIIDVTSAYVQIGSDNKTVTITFPAGLTDTSTALPDGRAWELVIDKGAFMDMTGNEFGAEADGSITAADAVQTAGVQSATTDTWKRMRTAITDGSAPVVLVRTEDGNDAFFSDKVATPVVRVDRYSYGLGAIQATASGSTTSYVASDGVRPTGYVRVRIDCETKDAAIAYSRITRNSDNSTISTSNYYLDNDNGGKCQSYYTVTRDLTASELSGTSPATHYSAVFACGNGRYDCASKDYVIANATKTGFTASDKGFEGVFQTVVRFYKAQDGAGDATGGNPTATKGTDSSGMVQTDWSIRGTTGFAGEPYISPFPLRDSQIGSPFLKICFRENTQSNKSTSVDYYWVSYEILVDSSFSGYGYGQGDNYYDWARNWGFMRPGEFTRCENMKLWR